MSARVIVDNNTGRALPASGCGRLFQVALGNAQAEQHPLVLQCPQRFTFPVGESRYPVTIEASYSRALRADHGAT
jgi:hypothetical protein